MRNGIIPKGIYKATKLVCFVRNESYEDHLRDLDLFLLEIRRLCGQLIEVFTILCGLINVDYSFMLRAKKYELEIIVLKSS